MISFWISVVPPKIDRTRGAPRAPNRAGKQRTGVPASQAGPVWSARAAAFARCKLGGDHPPGDRLAAWQLPGPRCGPDDDAEPAAADVPAVDADFDSGKLLAAQLPQGLGVHDASDGSQMGSCSREPPRGDQDLSRSEDAHHNSMGTCGAR